MRLSQLGSCLLKMERADGDFCLVLNYSFKNVVTQIVGTRTFLLTDINEPSNYIAIQSMGWLRPKLL